VRILVDTSVVCSLLNRRDQWHQRATRRHKAVLSARPIIILPRIVIIETISHITREARREDWRIKSLDSVYRLAWMVEEHPVKDFQQAEEWWRKYSDWPLEYPACLIVAAALRLKSAAIWTHDLRLGRFIAKEAPTTQSIDAA